MKVTMTNGEIVTTVNRIIGMQNREEKQETKLFGERVKVTYAIKKNKEKLQQLLKPYNESLDELIEKYKAEKPGEDGEPRIRKDCQKQWGDAVKELQEIEVEVDIHTVRFSEIEGLSLSLNDLEAIEFMLEEPEGFTE